MIFTRYDFDIIKQPDVPFIAKQGPKVQDIRIFRKIEPLKKGGALERLPCGKGYVLLCRKCLGCIYPNCKKPGLSE